MQTRLVRQSLAVLLSMALAVFLLYLLVKVSKLDFSTYWEAVKSAKPLFVLLVAVATFAQLWLAATKWALVTRRLVPDVSFRKGFFMFHMALSAAAGIVVPRTVGWVGIRSAAVKYSGRTSLLHAGFAAVYDQCFDMLVSLLILPAALLYVFCNLEALWAVGLTVLLLSGFLFVLSRFQDRVIGFLAGLYRVARRVLRRERHEGAAETGSPGTSVFNPGQSVRLFLLSILRYAVLAARAYCVALALDVDIGFSAILFAFPVLQFLTLIGLTPRNIGIAEWGWVGMLSLLGVSAQDATEFSLTLRIFATLSVLCVAFVSWLFFSIHVQQRRQSQ